jgi:hypothetical protein
MNIQRVHYALHKIEAKSVVTFDHSDWGRLVRADGTLTELEELPGPFNNPKLNASTLVAVASGMAVAQPGMDILRYDPGDEPFIINLDHYTIIENIHAHEIYPEALRVAGLKDSSELRFELQNNIYVIKEPPNEHHWLTDFPQHVLEAKLKWKP